MRCVTACLRKAIHPTLDDPRYVDAAQLHINPKRCISCGSCVTACLNGAILAPEDFPTQFPHLAEVNADWYRG